MSSLLDRGSIAWLCRHRLTVPASIVWMCQHCLTVPALLECASIAWLGWLCQHCLTVPVLRIICCFFFLFQKPSTGLTGFFVQVCTIFPSSILSILKFSNLKALCHFFNAGPLVWEGEVQMHGYFFTQTLTLCPMAKWKLQLSPEWLIAERNRYKLVPLWQLFEFVTCGYIWL